MELSDEWLNEHSQRAARYGSASIPCDDFLDIGFSGPHPSVWRVGLGSFAGNVRPR